MAVNQFSLLEMEDSAILETSSVSLRDDSEATDAASMATTSAAHYSQRDGAELMQILGIPAQTNPTPRRSSRRKRTQTAIPILRRIQDSALPPQNNMNQNSYDFMTLLEAMTRVNPCHPYNNNSSTFNHVTQQNSTLQSMVANQNNTFSARSGPLRVVQEYGASLPEIRPFTQAQISIDDLFRNWNQIKKKDSDTVDQKNPISSEAETELKLALDNMKKLSREVQTLKESRTCKLCMDKEVSQVLLPCGHVICCNHCIAKIQKCPICRAEIINSQIVYFS